MILSTSQIDEFIETGCTVVREAFPRKVAHGVCERVWDKIEARDSVRRDDRATWKPLVHLQESLNDELTAQAWSPRFCAAIDQLLGAARWHPISSLGWFPVSLPGFESAAWHAPKKGWHVDGQQFHHHLDSPDQGLLPLVILTDIAPGGGGTCIVPGSHKIVAQILQDAEPDGLSIEELSARVQHIPRDNAQEITGSAGDVALLHPFMLHARSMNTNDAIRIICNPCISLRAPMNLSGYAEETPLESSIRGTLKAETVRA